MARPSWASTPASTPRGRQRAGAASAAAKAASRCAASIPRGGRPQDLLVITDLSRALREEERQAWQRLIRVLGHELNNSLAPIKSMAGTLVACWRASRCPGTGARTSTPACG
jgi:hypothetical protein